VFPQQTETEPDLERSVSGLGNVPDCQRERTPDLEWMEARSRCQTMEGIEVTTGVSGRVCDRLSERVSPLEEFNTLHRHHPGVRASIKLKESGLV